MGGVVTRVRRGGTSAAPLPGDSPHTTGSGSGTISVPSFLALVAIRWKRQGRLVAAACKRNERTMGDRNDDILPDWGRVMQAQRLSCPLARYETSALQRFGTDHCHSGEIMDCSGVCCGDPSACMPYVRDLWVGKLVSASGHTKRRLAQGLVQELAECASALSPLIPLRLVITQQSSKHSRLRLNNSIKTRDSASTSPCEGGIPPPASRHSAKDRPGGNSI